MVNDLGWFEYLTLRFYGYAMLKWQEIPMVLLFGSGLLALFVALLSLLKKHWSRWLIERYLKTYYELVGVLGWAYLLSGSYWLTPLRFYQFTEESSLFKWSQIPYWLLTGFVVLGTQLFWFPKNRQRTWMRILVALILCLPIYYVLYIQFPFLQSSLMGRDVFRQVRYHHLYTPLAFAALIWLYTIVKLLVVKIVSGSRS